jgi:membrane glycosyltransferase
VGRGLRSAGLLLTPEERSPPPVLVRANALIAEPSGLAGDDPFAVLARDPDLFDAHLGMIGEPERRAKGDVYLDLIVALAKIEQAENREEAIGLLGRNEIFALLAHRDALRRLFAKPAADHGQIHTMRA